MPKTLIIQVGDETYQLFLKQTMAENCSISNFIETTVKEHIRECNFVDAFEMAEILTNEQLVERLRKGSKDALRKKGRMIE